MKLEYNDFQQKTTKTVSQTDFGSETIIKSPEKNWSFRSPKNVSETSAINLNLPPEEQSAPLVKKKLHLGWFIIPPATILAGVATYFILKNNLKKSSSDNGGPITPPGHGDDGGPVTPPGHGP